MPHPRTAFRLTSHIWLIQSLEILKKDPKVASSVEVQCTPKLLNFAVGGTEKETQFHVYTELIIKK